MDETVEPAPAPVADTDPAVTPSTDSVGYRDESFFERSATKAAILTTILTVWAVLRRILMEGVDATQAIFESGETVIYVWAAAFGVSTASAGVRRIVNGIGKK